MPLSQMTGRYQRQAIHPPARSIEVNAIDHRVRGRNGSTIALEAQNQRLQLAKSAPKLDLSHRLEELTKENGHLRLEIKFYRDCFGFAQQFRDVVEQIAQELQIEYFLSAVNLSVDESVGQRLSAVDTLETSKGLVDSLRKAVDEFIRKQGHVEEAWLAFWGSGDIFKKHAPLGMI